MSMPATPDLTVLSWIKTEIEQSLRSATAWVGPTVDEKHIAHSVEEVHRLGGALQIAGAQGLIHVCDAIEGVLRSMSLFPDFSHARALITRSVEALGQYLDQLLAGSPNRPMQLFPIYSELRKVQGYDKVSPADLFYPALNPLLPPVSAPTTEPIGSVAKTARKSYQRGMLAWLRGDNAGLNAMLDAVMQMDAVHRASTGFWWTASAFFEALGNGDIAPDSQVKKLCARVDAQLGRVEKESLSIAEGLFREILYFVARSKQATALVDQVIRVYRLHEHLAGASGTTAAVSEELADARSEVHQLLRATKDAWSQYCEEGDAHLDAFSEHLRALAHATRSMEFANVRTLLEGIREALAGSTFKSADERAIAVAGALLVSEEFLLTANVAQGETKIAQVLASLGVAGSNVADASQTRSNSDQHIEPALITEIVKSLKQVEHHVGAFFKDEKKKKELAEAIRHLQQALNVFQMASAQRAVVIVNHCLSMLQVWSQREEPSRTHEQESFAQSLTALDFYLLAKSRGDVLADDYVSPILSELGWTEPDKPTGPTPIQPSEAASVEAELQRDLRETLVVVDRWMRSNASTLAQLEAQLKSIYQDAVLVADKHAEQSSARALAMIQQARLEPIDHISQAISAIEQPAPAPCAEAPTDIPSDAEIAEVFLEEATEVLESIISNLKACEADTNACEAFATIRRGFHTLKGSSRMAGLSNLGEVAWNIERLLNHWIDQSLLPNGPILQLIAQAHAAFSRWVGALLQHGSVIIDGRHLTEGARKLLTGEAVEDCSPIPSVPAPMPAPQVALPHGGSVSTTLFKIFQGESHQHIHSLQQGLAAVNEGRPVQHEFMRAAHTLAGIARTLQAPGLAQLSYALENCLQRHLDLEHAPSAEQSAVYRDAIAELERQVSAVCERRPPPDANESLIARLDQALAVSSSIDVSTDALPDAVSPDQISDHTLSGAPGLDDLDDELRETFLQEALELTSELGANLQSWRVAPEDATLGAAVARGLHTFKGSARAAGAMMLGEQVHRIEEQVQLGIDNSSMTVEALDALLGRFDRWYMTFERTLKAGDTAPEIGAPAVKEEEESTPQTGATQMATMQLRVRADAIERLAEAAGELNIARARMGEQIRGARQVAFDLNDSVVRLRGQLREIEIQAESQMKARLTLLDERNAEFDPLEFDRFTRLQELSRFMVESLHDIGTVQHNLLRHFQDVDAVLTSHARVNRELNRELYKIQMVPFASVNDRLQRLMRQTSTELGKRGVLQIRGGQVELDRRLLEQILSPLEHMIRNAVAHGLESAEQRRRMGKDEVGKVTIALRQEANQVILVLADDGAGLDLPRIRAKALARQMITSDDSLSDDEIRELIFMAGFSTAEQVTEVSGRGVGMDVVRSAILTLGGDVSVASRPGEGSTFTLTLPLTMVVAQAVTIRVGARRFAIPAGLVQEILRCDEEQLVRMYSEGETLYREQHFLFHGLERLLGVPGVGKPTGGNNIVLLLASGEQRLALHVDQVFRNEEVPVKEIGPQLARAPGVTGASIGGDGHALLIINPLELVSRQAKAEKQSSAARSDESKHTPLVLVVDDSVTVRKVTSRLMVRAGYRVHTAKDGVEALDQLRGERPVAVLLDIEMPRMDGFELAQHIRADQRLATLPLIMISSRTAEKHRKHAQSLGVNEFLGKPYHEDELVSYVEKYRVGAVREMEAVA